MQSMEWISCSAQMPPSDEVVMTYDPKDSSVPVWPCYHDGEEWYDLLGGVVEDAHITHWMRFPAPPVPATAENDGVIVVPAVP